MKKATWILLAILSLSLAGCSKEAEINAFITELDAVTKELIEKIDADPTAAGIENAQKTLDLKKKDIRTKWDGIKGARGVQVEFGTRQRLEDSVTNNLKAMLAVQVKHAGAMASDSQASDALEELVADYRSIFVDSK